MTFLLTDERIVKIVSINVNTELKRGMSPMGGKF